MRMLFRNVDPRFPFLWEDGTRQPPSRWKSAGAPDPVHCLSDTADGAWAELLRHEEITDPTDLQGIERDLWAVEIHDQEPAAVEPSLSPKILRGDTSTYRACRAEAARIFDGGYRSFSAPSAALVAGGARGQVTDGGLRPGPDREGRIVVLIGARPDAVGWRAARRGRPGRELLERMNHF
jgi:hypothetical protein